MSLTDPRTGLPVVGMIGAGQLARMTHQAAVALGQSLRVLANDPVESAALVASDVRIGSHTDLAALRDFAKGCEVVTFDHEHVPQSHLKALLDEGIVLRPGPDALILAQDKLAMRASLARLGVPVPGWVAVGEPGDLRQVPWPVMLKAVSGGYDGRGVWSPADPEQAERLAARLLAAGTPLMAEQRVPLVRELAVVLARSPYGQVAIWPVVETVQRNGICVEVLAPAPGLDPTMATEAQLLAARIAEAIDVVGVLAVELFETVDGIVVNELAMRPHNSGHWTIDGAVTSQFEQHLRAVLDYPLGGVALRAPAVAMANVLGAADPVSMSLDERLHHVLAADPEARVHLYGKLPRPGRKLGHVTVPGDDMDGCRRRAVAAARRLAGEPEPELEPEPEPEPDASGNSTVTVG